MKFHNGYDYNPKIGVDIYQKLMLQNGNIRVGRSGFEVCRTGGSGGMTTNPILDNLLEFFHKHTTSSPRVTKAIKLFKNLHHTNYIILV